MEIKSAINPFAVTLSLSGPIAVRSFTCVGNVMILEISGRAIAEW